MPSITLQMITNLKEIGIATQLVKGWCDEMEYEVTLEEIAHDIHSMWKQGVVILAFDGGDIVGIMSGLPVWHFWVKKKIAHEHWFFVRPDYQKEGIGKLLLKKFSSWAAINNCQAVMIFPNAFGSANPEGIAEALKREGYKLHGYQMYKELENV